MQCKADFPLPSDLAAVHPYCRHASDSVNFYLVSTQLTSLDDARNCVKLINESITRTAFRIQQAGSKDAYVKLHAL
jgi:hypothetical protein